MIKHVPNILTIIRFLLIPVIVYFIKANNYFWAIIVFTISGITDIVDGFIARHFDATSNFGKLMDPLADKATHISLLIVLVSQNIIPLWILLAVTLKEIFMISRSLFPLW